LELILGFGRFKGGIGSGRAVPTLFILKEGGNFNSPILLGSLRERILGIGGFKGVNSLEIFFSTLDHFLSKIQEGL